MVWKECWWQLRIFKHKSYGETALKPTRGSGECCELPSGVRHLLLFRRFFKDKMHRLVTFQVVTPKLHTVPMRTIGRDAADILLGDALSGSALTCLNEVKGNTETE